MGFITASNKWSIYITIPNFQLYFTFLMEATSVYTVNYQQKVRSMNTKNIFKNGTMRWHYFTHPRGGRYGKNIISCLFFKFHDFITILCHVGFTILSEQCSKNKCPIIKTKPFKISKYKIKKGRYLGQNGQNLCHYFIFVIKKKPNIHITNTHKINSALFSGTIGIFSRSIQEIEWTNIKIKHYID